jgi:hypothetical protein
LGRSASTSFGVPAIDLESSSMLIKKTRQYFQTPAFLSMAPGVGSLTIASMLSVLVAVIGPSVEAAGETPKDMLAAQIRTQGVACAKPLSAVRDAQRSKPDHEVWVLKCSNATYRISRAPDMAAKIEQLQ